MLSILNVKLGQLKLGRLMIVGLLSLSLGLGSVLGFSAIAQAASVDDYYRNQRGELQSTERYDEIQPQVGGMNQYNDTDPRRETTGPEAKADELIDRSERTQAQSRDPLEPVREAIGDFGNRLGDTADNAKASAERAVDSVR